MYRFFNCKTISAELKKDVAEYLHESHKDLSRIDIRESQNKRLPHEISVCKNNIRTIHNKIKKRGIVDIEEATELGFHWYNKQKVERGHKL